MDPIASSEDSRCSTCGQPRSRPGSPGSSSSRLQRQNHTVTKVHADDPVFTSGEAAASKLLRPASTTLYVGELEPKLAIVNRWRSDGPANIVVRRKFWHAPDDSDLPLPAYAQPPGHWCTRT